jgi:hypothetical protein
MVREVNEAAAVGCEDEDDLCAWGGGLGGGGLNVA